MEEKPPQKTSEKEKLINNDYAKDKEDEKSVVGRGHALLHEQMPNINKKMSDSQFSEFLTSF